MKLKTFGIFCLFFLIAITVIAQEKNKTTDETSYFKLSGSYLTNSVYSGRKDSARLPYLTPSLTYFAKSGFHIGVAVSYLKSAEASRIDLFSVDAGYDFTINNQLTGSVYLSKYFYNKSSTAVQGEAKGLLGGELTYSTNILTLNADFGVLFSQNSDFIFNPSLSHPFYIGENMNTWGISPTVTANIGTLNYYKQYEGGVNSRRRGGGTTPIEQVKNADGMLLLNYELSLPITYDGNKWGLFFTPAYSIPQSPVELTLPGGTVFKQETLENSFYAEFGLYIKF